MDTELKEKIETLQEKMSLALQADHEQGVAWMNEEYSKKWAKENPLITKAIAEFLALDLEDDINIVQPELDVSIDTSEDFETITMTFTTENKENVSIVFSIAEVQMLSMWLNEAVGAVLSRKIGLTPTPETKH